MKRAAAMISSAVLACVLLAGCGGDEPDAVAVLDPTESPKLLLAVETEPEPEPEPDPEPAPQPVPAPPQPAAERPPGECGEGRYERMRSQRIAHAAVARHALQAFARPGGAPLARFAAVNVNGVRTTFGVLGRVLDRDCRLRWYRVQLPMKPNGVVGYVRAADVELSVTRARVLVELSKRRVTVFYDGEQVLQAPAAVGSSRTPTPTGNYYVNQRLRPHDPRGPFGPGAVGISAFTEVLTGWAQGGPIALHGTNRPDSIGHAVSNGCVRLRNDVLQEVFALARPGTPVVVRP
jgi:hypothetical protein